MMTITSPAAYHGHAINWSNFFPFFLRSAVKEPLLIPLMVGGISLAAYRVILGNKDGSITFGLWFGSFLYFLSLILGRLVSKYYAALPLFGFALYFYFELQRSRLRKSATALFCSLVLANLLLWGPAIVYKHDWTRRNSELADQLVTRLQTDNQHEVLVADSDGWDAAMFIIYAKKIRKIDAQFYCNGAWYRAYAALCPVDENKSAANLKIKLTPVGENERSAKLIVGSSEVWHYQSIWIRWILESIRDLLSPHYSYW
jgi:hypothetical protein